MKRSRYLLIAIAVACVLSLTACNGQNQAGNENSTATASPSTVSDDTPSSTASTDNSSSTSDTEERWTGDEVWVKDYQMVTVLTKEQEEALQEVEAWKEATGFGKSMVEFPYRSAVIYGSAKPNMRRITVEEVRQIVADIEEEVREEIANGSKPRVEEAVATEIREAIQKIQGCYDQLGNTYRCYWLDSDRYDERRQEICLVCVGDCVLFLNTYDENNQNISHEEIFSYPKFVKELTGNYP